MYNAYHMICKLLYRRRFDLIAVSLTAIYGQMLTQLVRNCVRESGIRRAVCSGDVFMNARAKIPNIQRVSTQYDFLVLPQ